MRPEGPARAEAGLAGRVLAAQLLDAGLRELDHFDANAEPLRWLARFIVDRAR